MSGRAEAAGRPHVVVVGDVVLDRDVEGRVDRLCPDAPAPVLDVTHVRESPGGAGLTALLAAEGARVTLVAPVADDAAGRRLTEHLGGVLDVVALPHAGGTRRKVRVRSAAHSLVRIDDGGPGTPGAVPVDAVRRVLADADVVLVSDYGAGVTRDADLRALLAEAAAARPVVWDPHPRGGSPVPGVTLVTPNLGEARDALRDAPPGADGPRDQLAQRLRELWHARAVAVTAGADGAFVAAGGETQYVPAPHVAGGDPCGAGDRFAASAALALAAGALPAEAVGRGVADASAWVAAGGAEAYRRRADEARGPVHAPDDATATRTDAAATPDGARTARPGRTHAADGVPADELTALAARLRAGGRSLVATGGCFDIVHAGHVATLQAARRLGDALVVLMNSDASVRRLKGEGRPVVTAPDRARVLEALDCVAAVVVFDEDDPRSALDRLRPDVWAKGGDYGGAPLPEAATVRAHGGRVVLLPYLDGRSTTSIIARSGAVLAPATTTEETV
ncbi:PfkB family carbohydrate kinase [Cellulomonas shaoxiangyii]|uniref:Bifunctional heptose 7-phosphate kinase/heptose 1-phosphate adenyltransferase n=1 Tax=Cellulomonas shaoxiangyii TaxID=2566013 RepID=A0A4P7SKP1_9CELL|nr:PfkB family carbohydrate kinase [Cellulomonas shaoxiangyii]QCB93726.1 bifunctional heptose 7-phosphate kinase/heptose 1-phosphate adenyltransferase [Cellulomonas shaoxiangyii]TGY81118.1 bifunctional heptose 7-phosphate kinase/heptose 1-phosphate adenyltransferase [Cellulomonas shaoxiangyii]